MQSNILLIFNHLNEASADRIIQKRFFYNFFLFGLILWKAFARKSCDHYILLQYEWVKRIWPVDTFFVDRTENFKIFSFLEYLQWFIISHIIQSLLTVFILYFCMKMSINVHFDLLSSFYFFFIILCSLIFYLLDTISETCI